MKDLAFGIIRGVVVNVVGDMNEHVDTDHIDRAKSRGLWPPDQRSGQAIDFFDCEAVLLHQLNGFQRREKPDAVCDEVRRVFGVNDAFTENDFCKSFEPFSASRSVSGVGMISSSLM